MSAVSVESLDVSVIHFLPYMLFAYTVYHTTQWLKFAASWRCLCRQWFSTSWFAFGFYLDFWWWVSWRPWAICFWDLFEIFWATELVEPEILIQYGSYGEGLGPFASRGAAPFLKWMISAMSWANGTQLWMLCLRSTCFCQLEELLQPKGAAFQAANLDMLVTLSLYLPVDSSYTIHVLNFGHSKIDSR